MYFDIKVGRNDLMKKYLYDQELCIEKQFKYALKKLKQVFRAHN